MKKKIILYYLKILSIKDLNDITRIATNRDMHAYKIYNNRKINHDLVIQNNKKSKVLHSKIRIIFILFMNDIHYSFSTELVFFYMPYVLKKSLK